VTAGLAVAPKGLSMRQFIGAACLCGIGDTMALLVADRAFGPLEAEVAKLAVPVGSVIAGTLGTIIGRVRIRSRPMQIGSRQHATPDAGAFPLELGRAPAASDRPASPPLLRRCPQGGPVSIHR
jgi:hypothetical protein